MEGKRIAIIDKDGNHLLDVVESTSTPGVFWIVALNPDGSDVQWGGGGGWVTPDSVTTFTNKTIDDYTNHVHADGIHARVKATVPVSHWQPVARVGYNAWEDAIEVAPRSDWTTPIVGIMHDDLNTGEFGLMLTVWDITVVDTSAFSDWAILYPDDAGGFTTTPDISNGNYNQPLAYVQKSAINGILQILVWPGHDIAKMVAFDNSTTDLVSTNAENAIIEVNEKLNLHDHTSVGEQVPEGGLVLSDVTTNNATTTKHGFLPKLSGSGSEFLNGQGNFTTPGGTTTSFLTQTFTSQTSVTVTHNFGTYPAVQIMETAGGKVILPLEITHTSANAFTVTFTTATTGRIIATVGSPQPQSYVAVNSDYSVLTTDYCVNVTSGNATLTLPTSVGNTGRIYDIKNSGNGTVTLNTTSSQTIDWQISGAVKMVQYDALRLLSNGANWIILA